MTNNQAQTGSFSFQEKTKKLRKKALREQRAGKLAEAKALYQTLIQRDPADGQSYYNLGKLLKEMNQPVEAAAYLEKAITLGIKSSDVFSDLADAFINISRFEDALPMAKAAVTLNPNNAQGLRALINGLSSQGQYEQAIKYGEKLVSLSVNNADSHLLLAMVNGDFGLHLPAIKHANHAINLNPKSAEAFHIICLANQNLQEWDKAMDMVNKALEIEPNNSKFIITKIGILELQGHIEKAYSLLKPLVKDESKIYVKAIHAYSRLSKKFGEQRDALPLLEKVLNIKQLPVSLLSQTYNLLAMIYDDLEQYDNAFAAAYQFNTMKPQRYNDDANEKLTNNIIKWFTKEHLQHTPVATCDSRQPIFIVGMPRSGTSLTEKILSRHPNVIAGGELGLIKQIADYGFPESLNTREPFPFYLQNISIDTVNKIAEHYLEHIAQLTKNSEPHITDKMPMNFIYLGVINLLFPQARVINCTRNPLDIGLSCYFVNFASVDDMGFTQDLTTIGNYYNRYEKLMTHWHDVLPLPIYDLSYESLVSDPEVEIKKLLEFCELPWHEECLTPHKSKEASMTASYNQVRKPIYTKSIGRWKNYEQHLQPLKDVLGLS